MNSLWIRSEDGKELLLANKMSLVSANGATYCLLVNGCAVAECGDIDRAVLQLDDIQQWIADGISTTTYRYEDEKYNCPRIYDLRERKVKEGATCRSES